MTEAFPLAFLKGPVQPLGWVLSDLSVCGIYRGNQTVLGPVWDLDPFLFCEVRLAGGCRLDEMMSGLEAEGSGNCADFCPSSENQALPFFTFSVSKWFLIFFFLF